MDTIPSTTERLGPLRLTATHFTARRQMALQTLVLPLQGVNQVVDVLVEFGVATRRILAGLLLALGQLLWVLVVLAVPQGVRELGCACHQLAGVLSVKFGLFARLLDDNHTLKKRREEIRRLLLFLSLCYRQPLLIGSYFNLYPTVIFNKLLKEIYSYLIFFAF